MPYPIHRCQRNRVTATVLIFTGIAVCLCSADTLLPPSTITEFFNLPSQSGSSAPVVLMTLGTTLLAFIYPVMVVFIGFYHLSHLLITSILHIISLYVLYGLKGFVDPMWPLRMLVLHVPLIMAFNLLHSSITASTPSEMQMYRDFHEVLDHMETRDVVELEKERILIDLA